MEGQNMGFIYFPIRGIDFGQQNVFFFQYSTKVLLSAMSLSYMFILLGF